MENILNRTFLLIMVCHQSFHECKALTQKSAFRILPIPEYYFRFRSIAKDADFYATQADNEQRRCYFYNIDLQGRLFLEETFPKNIATSIKDERFLNFFFRRVQAVDVQIQCDVMEPRQIPVQDYPFVSPCGRELNFIRPAASPFVFHGLVEGSIDIEKSQQAPQLVYGGTLRQAFAWNFLAVSPVTGRIYHARKGEQKDNAPAIPYGLVRSQLAVSLVEQMEIVEQDNNNDDDQEEILAYRDGDGSLHSVQWLPEEAEPGAWAMPWECEQ